MSTDLSLDTLAEFVDLENERRELEAKLDSIKQRTATLQREILDEWAERGQQSANVNGLCVYVTKSFVCNKRGGVAPGEVCEAMTRNGLGTLVAPNYNASSLKAWVKEQVTDGNPLPEDLGMLLYYEDLPALRTRRG